MNDRQERAAEPEDLARLFVERANAGDADGLAALYGGRGARLPPGQVTEGRAAIRAIYEQLIAKASPSSSRRRCPRSGRAISRLPQRTGRIRVQIARRQADEAGCPSIGPSRPSPPTARSCVSSTRRRSMERGRRTFEDAVTTNAAMNARPWLAHTRMAMPACSSLRHRAHELLAAAISTYRDLPGQLPLQTAPPRSDTPPRRRGRQLSASPFARQSRCPAGIKGQMVVRWD